MEMKRCISSLTLEQLTAELKAMGQPGFRAKQLFHWVHQKLVTDFSAMTDQPKALLAKLEEAFYIAAPIIERRQEAKDGTVKYLLRMADGNCIETVVMRYHYGNTVCVSTQVGCRMGCRFCASTQAGRVRNLEAGEICSEIYTAQKDIGERISHIVLMGIGEPLDSMVRGVNDSDACARQLADLIRGMGAHVNLIPINPVDGSPYSATDAANVRRFQQKLESLGVNATVRRRLGSEISAACGQLRRDEMNGKA